MRNAILILTMGLLGACDTEHEEIEHEKSDLRGYDPCVIDARTEPVVIDVWPSGFTSTAWSAWSACSECEDGMTVLVPSLRDGTLDMSVIRWVRHGADISLVGDVSIGIEATPVPVCDSDNQSCPPDPLDSDHWVGDCDPQLQCCDLKKIYIEFGDSCETVPHGLDCF
jgi:hypothetical protein